MEPAHLTSLLVAAVSTLCGALAFVAKLLLARTDRANAELIAELRARCAEFEERANRFEALTLRLLRAAQEATVVATEAVKERTQR